MTLATHADLFDDDLTRSGTARTRQSRLLRTASQLYCGQFTLTCPNVVEAVGTSSNTGHLCKKFADLRKRIQEEPPRLPLLAQDVRKPRSKRFLTTDDLTDIVHRYEAGETTQQIGNRYGISKTRVATILREHGITIRRQGLTMNR